MAAPTATAYQAPSGRKLVRGHKTLMIFSNNPTIALWTKKVKPPGKSGGEAINNTDMHHDTYRTKRSRGLIENMNAEVTYHYDPKALTQIEQQINREQALTIRYSDGSTYAFWGYLQEWEPDEIDEESTDPPTAKCTFVETDWDPVNHVEAGPVMTEVAGT